MPGDVAQRPRGFVTQSGLQFAKAQVAHPAELSIISVRAGGSAENDVSGFDQLLAQFLHGCDLVIALDRPEPEQFSMDLGSAPQWVLKTHSSDQSVHLFTDPRPASEWTRFPSPIRDIRILTGY